MKPRDVIDRCPGCECTRYCDGCGCYGCYRPACRCYQPLEGAVTRPPDVRITPPTPRVLVKEGPVKPPPAWFRGRR
jgi:hypothetical protein